MKNETRKFQVAILGGGITGSSIFHILSKYTNIDSIALIEKAGKLGEINSKESNNSQTLHFGDIEANYSVEKAISSKEASQMVVRYLERLGGNGSGIYKKSHKMLLAVGKKEIAEFEKRQNEFKKIFPNFKKITRNEIAKIEPEIVNGRKPSEKIMAGYSKNGFTVDFGALAKNLATEAKKFKAGAKIFVDTKVIKIIGKEDGFEIITNKETFFAQAVVVAMCSHSLMFAKELGYGKEYSILPVGGNFYTSSRKVLNGKVYTMQSGKLPFAGVHGDPNVHNENETRFGPTANVMPFLERNNIATFGDFFKSTLCDKKSAIALLKVLSEKTLLTFLLKNLIYEIPYFGPRAYAKMCQKIIPTLKYADFKNSKTKAGIRPQLINNQTQKLQMGEIEIEGKNILFNITPSPGATACIKNAAKSVNKTIAFFDGKYSFNEDAFKRDFLS
ncbi:MAG TPA: FAD-dependent oxidoreductase [Candidatus Moranbacteria bacterium]|nr:FAD-dependent oxidoreductase [Candidatus Moranbacteria bacterium]HBT45264.1 FAD-dependent oxidoreductase [Candidatus Moranbacteria bacterium]